MTYTPSKARAPLAEMPELSAAPVKKLTK